MHSALTRNALKDDRGDRRKEEINAQQHNEDRLISAALAVCVENARADEKHEPYDKGQDNRRH